MTWVGIVVVVLVMVILWDVYRRYKRIIMKYFLSPANRGRFLHPLGVWLLTKLSEKKVLKGQGPLWMALEEDVEDGIHFRDMFLGITLGDAFGAGIEMMSREWICENVDFTCYVSERQKKKPSMNINYCSGLYTDDAEMTFGLVDALLSCKSLPDESTLIKFWKAEFDKNKNWIGIPRQGYGGIKDYFLGVATLESIREHHRTSRFPGNAPPMRSVPIGVMHLNQIVPLSIVNADSTHPHPKSRAASLSVAWAAYYFFHRLGPHQDVIDYVIDNFLKAEVEYSTSGPLWDEDYKEGLIAVNKLPDWTKAKILKGNIVDLDYTLLCGEKQWLGADSMRTAFCVLYFLKYYSTPFELLKMCMKIGGDVDSLASICLGIVGGAYGLGLSSNQPGSIPVWLIDCLEGYPIIKRLSSQYKLWYKQNKTSPVPK